MLNSNESSQHNSEKVSKHKKIASSYVESSETHIELQIENIKSGRDQEIKKLQSKIFSMRKNLSKAKILDKFIRKTKSDRKTIISILDQLSYAPVYKNRRSLEMISNLMKIKAKVFLKLFMSKSPELATALDTLQKKHPLLLIYLNHIFKNNRIWKSCFDRASKLETLLEKCYFDKQNRSSLKGNYSVD